MPLRRSSTPDPTLYHVVIEADDENQDVRSRMGLLNSAMARVIHGADDFTVRLADYERGYLELDVWTTRLRGITDGRVSINVRQVVSA